MPPEPTADHAASARRPAPALARRRRAPTLLGGLLAAAPAAAQTADDTLLATATGLEQTLIALYGVGAVERPPRQLAEDASPRPCASTPACT